MNAPMKFKTESRAGSSAPSRFRAHLLHQLGRELSPESLRDLTQGGGAPLPRRYWQQALGTQLQDFLGRNSKMFRASLVEWAWKGAGGTGDFPTQFSTAAEALHAGSLIIDDIEDLATMRRGDTALHARYGLAPALNAGNWLYFWPTRLIEEAGLAPDRELAALKKISETQYRCHVGQGLDVSLRVQDIHQEDMFDVVRTKTDLKTSVLVGLSTFLGALAAGASLKECETFARFGERFGMVLQKLDDAGTLTSERRDEKAEEDIFLGTATWPWAWAATGLDTETYDGLIKSSIRIQEERRDYSGLRRQLSDLIPEDFDSSLLKELQIALDGVQHAIQDETCIATVHEVFKKMRQGYV